MAEVSCGEIVESPAEDVSVLVEEGAAVPVVSIGDKELSTPVVAAPIAELLLGTADVVSAGTPFTP
jgi:hypothetical protein